jgi:hypothetical protein
MKDTLTCVASSKRSAMVDVARAPTDPYPSLDSRYFPVVPCTVIYATLILSMRGGLGEFTLRNYTGKMLK